MCKNLFKILLILSIASVALSGHNRTQISVKPTEEYDQDLDIKPYVKVGNKLYYFGQEKATWYKSFLTCRSIGGFLASLETQEQLTLLSNYLIANYPTDHWWWLSGSDQDVEGNFFWYRTGERITIGGWSPGQPDNMGGRENCVHLWHQKTQYLMNDWQCNQAAYFICETDKPKSIIMSIF